MSNRGKPLLDVRQLCKSYPSGDETLIVLDHLDLRVERGQMTAVTGESGSGKSTFLHLVGGMEKPDSGSICFDGTDITRLDIEELAEFRNRRIGFVFQFHHLLPEFSALENVMFPLLLRRWSPQQARERGRYLLVEMGLEKRMHHQPGELSGGEQQRVAMARALAGEPELLLADEPTGNLDLGTSEKIHELLQRVHRQYGLTSIIVTHNPRLAMLCDEVKNMEGGKLREVEAVG
ncbi:MAG TPA: ABC transporter ATP-binding protein [Acidobacteriota bacterium]|nr:ABC transporter ATP-binding protein [Acidobacteriota bacterium]